MSGKNAEPLFHNNVLYLEDCDFTSDGRLSLPPPYNGKHCLVMIFAHWCGPCKMTKPEYAKLKNLVGKDVVICAINGSGQKDSYKSEQDLMSRLKDIIPDFKGFPHIAVFGKDGKLLGAHEGKRTADDMIKTVKKYSS